jgi:uncharacterized membrane protein
MDFFLQSMLNLESTSLVSASILWYFPLHLYYFPHTVSITAIQFYWMDQIFQCYIHIIWVLLFFVFGDYWK